MTPLVWVSAHDYPSAQACIEAGVDTLLVGDSLGMTVYGLSSTREVNMEMMLRHTEAVLRGVPEDFPVIADMPYESYDTPEEALRNANSFRDIGISRLKLEGGEEIFGQVECLITNGFSITGHLGVLPQTAKSFSIVGRDEQGARKLLADAHGLSQRGVEFLVLECVPEILARKVTASLSMPTIGIGAGKYTSGQILVFPDIVGRTSGEFTPKFLRRFGNEKKWNIDALAEYVSAVRCGDFPHEKESYS